MIFDASCPRDIPGLDTTTMQGIVNQDVLIIISMRLLIIMTLTTTTAARVRPFFIILLEFYEEVDSVLSTSTSGALTGSGERILIVITKA